MKLKPGSCLIIGGCTIDAVYNYTGVFQENLCGGNSLFAAVGANYWLEPRTVKIISTVGFDYPQEWLDMVSAAGIDISGIERVNSPHERVFTASYDRFGQRTFIDTEIITSLAEEQKTSPSSGSQRGSITSPLLTGQALNHLESANFVHCAPVLPDVFFKNLGILRQADLWLQADPGEESADWSAKQHLTALELVDAYLPSTEEVDDVTRDFMEKFPDDSIAKRPDVIAVKSGMKGSLIHRRCTKPLLIPVIPVEATDPTGAGDAYCGGFLAGMALTGNPLAAGLAGTVSASFVVESSGVLRALHPTPQVLIDRLTWLENQVQIPLTNEEEAALRQSIST